MRATAGWLGSVLSLGLAAASLAGSADDVPGLRLAERLEAHMAARQSRLRWESLGHYALIAEVEQADLLRWTEPVSFWRGEDGLVVGVGDTVELHGGALLHFLFQHWRPDARRPAAPSDRFPFRHNGESVALADLYASHRSQIFLPVPGIAPAEIRGQLPGSPQLARMRFLVPDGDGVPRGVERDAYSFLGLLIAREKDFAASWTNRLGQPLSVDLLMEQAAGRYLSERSAQAERSDHSQLHLIELFLAHHRRASSRPGAAVRVDPDEIKRRFLTVELERRDADDESLAHYVESLGLLFAEPAVTWNADERERARSWLRGVEASRFRDLAAVDADYLAHLLRGLRLVCAHGDRLKAPRDGSSGVP
jgi:hypothetical protein